MKLLFFRLAGCAVGLLSGCLLFNNLLTPGNFILRVVFMALLFTFLRPLMNILILPFNMLLAGLPGLFADALLVWWAAGSGFGYLQAIAVAVVIAACYWPYGRYKKTWMQGSASSTTGMRR